MKVQAIQHTDVRGKVQNYIKISNGEHHVIINVGEKTYQAVKDLETVQELPLNTKGGKIPEIKIPKT